MNTDSFPRQPILVIDDEEYALDALEMTLYANGFDNIHLLNDSRQAMDTIRQINPSVILLDLVMPFLTGDALLLTIKENYPDIRIIMVSGFNDAEKAVACIHAGAFDYLLKPVEAERLVTVIRRALELNELCLENKLLKKQLFSKDLQHPDTFEHIITASQEMFSIFKYIEAISPSSQCVLITGETGTGKELIIQAIHSLSRQQGKLVTVNVAGLDDLMFADTLFGHEKAAFTGADRGRAGLIEQAAGGTLFLDEIGDLHPGSQVKLLRLLQEQEYLPLGVDEPRQSTARVVAATSRDLHTLKQEEVFRKDFYYRILTHHIHLPPLRDRLATDLALLVEHFLKKAAADLDKQTPTPPDELLSLLSIYNFPGNIRELESIIYDAVSCHTSGVLSLDSCKDYIAGTNTISSTPPAVESESTMVFPDKLPTLKACSTLLVQEALQRSQGNQSLAARMLGVSTQALNQRLKRMSAAANS